ncbi:hybrid signal transduction histidine kinase M [Tanacetum coccineum]|uniref:Hybrid signal transduction histidine kinase M n=1 Tax=Tanacetum coccineum TaxID=301880 RepID=A0ABQ4YWQ9_9ASTR
MVLMADSGNSRRSLSSQDKSWRPCFNFAKGTCRFGDGCRFVHDANAQNNTNSGVDINNSSIDDLLARLVERLGLSNKLDKPSDDHMHTNKSTSNSQINPTVYYASPGPVYHQTVQPSSSVPPISPPPKLGYPTVYMSGPITLVSPVQATYATSAQAPPGHHIMLQAHQATSYTYLVTQLAPQALSRPIAVTLRSVGPTATLGQATTFLHAFTAMTLHDPASGA